MNVGDITSNTIIIQRFKNHIEKIESISIMVSSFNANIIGDLNVEIKDVQQNKVIAKETFSNKDIEQNDSIIINISNRMLLKDKIIELRITSNTGIPASAATVFYSKESIPNLENGQLSINNVIIPGSLCFETRGIDEIWISNYYVFIIIFLLICTSIFYWISAIRYEKSKKELIFSFQNVFDKYKFLIKQLVNRDFKVRYKSSVLGMLWSVLNPLLTALIQYIVFSQVFKADIENFPVYLLSGTIIFNFFNEAISLSLISIVGNANLITKVYVPKYIYPISKILSSVINFILSLIPLTIIMIITGEKITKAFFLLPIFFLNVLFFTMGIGLFLSTLMVFFRDIQFLWSVLSLMWMYLTPLFYPADILPKQFAWILKYNPMYYFIDATRTIIMNGVSPEPKMYLQCFIFSITSLTLGILFFKGKQDKFIFYI